MSKQRELQTLLEKAKGIQSDVSEGAITSAPRKVVPRELLTGARPYIEKIAAQIDGSYGQGWYDACLVMMRRLVETLLIECFENQNCSSAITDDDNNYVSLSNMIDKAESGHHIQFSRDAPKRMRRVKRHADNSAHNRYYTATQTEIEDLRTPYHILINELTEISGMSS